MGKSTGHPYPSSSSHLPIPPSPVTSACGSNLAQPSRDASREARTSSESSWSWKRVRNSCGDAETRQWHVPKKRPCLLHMNQVGGMAKSWVSIPSRIHHKISRLRIRMPFCHVRSVQNPLSLSLMDCDIPPILGSTTLYNHQPTEILEHCSIVMSAPIYCWKRFDFHTGGCHHLLQLLQGCKMILSNLRKEAILRVNLSIGGDGNDRDKYVTTHHNLSG